MITDKFWILSEQKDITKKMNCNFDINFRFSEEISDVADFSEGWRQGFPLEKSDVAGF